MNHGPSRGERDLECLLDVAAALSRAPTTAAVVDAVLTAGLDAFGALTGGVALVAADGQHLEIVGTRGVRHAGHDRYARLALDDPHPLTQVLRSREAEWIESPEDYLARYPAFAAEALQISPARAFSCAPLLIDGRGIGVVRFGFAAPRRFDEHDRRLTRILAEQCALALERARLHDAERDASVGLDTLLDAAPCGIAFLDRDLRYLRVNRHLAQAAGLTPEAFRGKALREMQPAIAPMIEPALRRVIETGAPILDLVCGGGEPLRASANIYALRGSGGSTLGAAFTTVSVSALQASEERLRLALSAARMFAWEWDSARRRVVHTDNAVEILGLHPGQSLESSDAFAALVHPDDARVHESLVRDAILRGQSYQAKYRVLRPIDGRVVWIESGGRGVCDAGGKPVRALGVMMDVTARQEAELSRAQAELSSQLKDEFLARVSHELRTPLAAMRMWIQVLRSGRPEDRSAAVEAIDRSAKTQAKLIGDLLDLARGLNGKLRITEEVFDPREAIAEAIALIRPEAEARSILLLSALGSDVGFIRGDAGRLQQVVTNLVSNAVKFTPPGGRIEVLLRADGSSLVLAVSDTGVGLDLASLEAIFAPFHQHDAGEPSDGGLGLGLAIARQLVELHGGTVRAESRGRGSGATFTVRLPRVPEEELAPTPSQARVLRRAAPPLAGLRVMLVEDHASTREGIVRVLSSLGAEVVPAASARDALRALDQSPPDVILSDLAMPDEDGCALIRKVRALPCALAATPAVALTAHARPEDVARALAAGFHVHLAKPVDSDHLVDVIAGLTGRKRGRRHRGSWSR